MDKGQPVVIGHPTVISQPHQAQSLPQMTAAMQGAPPMLSDDLSLAIRQGFVRKVMLIVTCQLIVTTLISLPFLLNKDDMRIWRAENPQVYMMCLVGVIGVLGVMCCCPDKMRQYPTNYIILSVFTIAEGVMVGMFTLMFNSESVVMAFGVTCAVTFGLMLFATQTKYDFTGSGSYLFAGLLCLVLFGFLFMFFPHSETMMKVYAGGGALLFSMYLVYDMQLIIGGKHKTNQFSIDDYCFAALNLYMDIIQLFIYFLMLFGDRN